MTSMMCALSWWTWADYKKVVSEEEAHISQLVCLRELGTNNYKKVH